MTLALRPNMAVFTKKMQEYVPLRNMQVSIAALQKLLKTYYGEEWRNEKIIWLNSKIKYNKSILSTMKKFAEAGITEYEHLLSPEKQCLSYDDLTLKFGLLQTNQDFCAYIKLVAKLPKQWDKDEIRTKVQISLEQLHNVRTVFDQLSNVKAIYRYLIQKTTKLPLEQQAKWSSELKDQNLQWNSVYRSVYSSTIETKLRSFQIKLDLRSIVTNVALHGFCISDTNKCSFCKIEPETLLHLFFECRIIQVIWNDVMDWISSKLKTPLAFRPSEILFGVEGENYQAKLINCVLLCITFYIYKSRISGNLPTTNEALLYIRTVCLSEKKNWQKKIRNYINTMENGVVYNINRYIVRKHVLEYYVCYVCYLSALRMCNYVCLVFCFFFLFCVM